MPGFTAREMNGYNAKVLFFCRAPELGRVKKRLARDMGDQAALKVYRQLLEHNLAMIEHIDFAGVEIITTNVSHSFFESYQQKGIVVRQQLGDSLGSKLIDAFATALADTDKVVLLGTDSFDVTVEHLKQAVTVLNKHDAVITPVKDGGYILIGLKKMYHPVFQDMPWGTDQVFDHTRQRLIDAGLSFYTQQMLTDIDEVKDLSRLNFKTDPTAGAGE